MPQKKYFDFYRDKKASVAVTTAVIFAVVTGFAAMSINAGTLYYSKRRQQAANDLAAIAAASTSGNQSQLATNSVVSNGFSGNDISGLETGSYSTDPSVPVARRFVSGSPNPNAVRITMRKASPLFFSSIFNLIGKGGSQAGGIITTTSIAASRGLAAFSIGSGLVALNGGIENAVLSALLGTNLSLSAMDYQALASTKIDLFSFSNALATRVNATSGTYASLAASNITLPMALGALSDAASSSAQSYAAIASIRASVGNLTSTLKLTTILNFGPYGNNLVGGVGPLTASVSALDLISAFAQAGSGGHQMSTSVSLGIPGISFAQISAVIGEPPVGSSLIAIGSKNTTLYTAQTRLMISLQVAGVAPMSLINVPILVDLAPSSATLTGIQCGTTQQVSSVSVSVMPGVANAWIGAVSSSDWNALSVLPSPSYATLVNVVGVVRVDARAQATIANLTPTNVSFSYADITNQTRKTTSTTDYLSSLLSSLFGGMQLQVSIAGLPLFSSSQVGSAITQTLVSNIVPIDQIIASTLSALGISVGNATVWVSGIKCGQSALVN